MKRIYKNNPEVFQVSKYDPIFRNAEGAYQKDEWTDFSDIGKTFEGKVFTEEEYYQTEDRYVAFALEALKQAGDECVRVRLLENHGNLPNVPKNGDTLSPKEFAAELRRCLRCEYWCVFEGENLSIDIGYDYYMHISGIDFDSPETAKLLEKYNLFAREIPKWNSKKIKKPLNENTVRVIKIGKKALFEFIYEHMIDEQEMHMYLDSTTVMSSFDINWERGEFIFCVSKAEDENGKMLNLNEVDLQKVMRNIPDTADSMYAAGRKYREYTRAELQELSVKV